MFFGTACYGNHPAARVHRSMRRDACAVALHEDTVERIRFAVSEDASCLALHQDTLRPIQCGVSEDASCLALYQDVVRRIWFAREELSAVPLQRNCVSCLQHDISKHIVW
jgi:hypothetical protein